MLWRVARLDPNDARPAYRQVADRLRESIEAAELAPGAQLPTQRDIAEDYGVAVETVKRALAQLRSEGLIVTRQGKGSYVRSDGVNAGSGEPDIAQIAAHLAELSRDLAAIKKRIDALEAHADGASQRS